LDEVKQMSKSIIYPKPLKKGDRIAVTAPSSGVEEHLHILLHQARENVTRAGFTVVEGETIWTENKAASAPKEKRAQELMNFLCDDSISAIIPPWGGQFLIDILPLLDWETLRKAGPKWILGYSDTSTLLFCYTLNTGYASAHGTNYCDLSAQKWDSLTAKWVDVLGTATGGSITQHSSEMYQSSWERTHQNPGTGFYFDTPTEWKVLGSEQKPKKKVTVTGRLLGGCLETLVSLVGTPYAPVHDFTKNYMQEGVLWYLESAESSAAQIYRALWTMRENGWFERANGILFGRPGRYRDTKNFTLTDALHAIFDPLGIPVIYVVDLGHQPPQMILVNGALARVTEENGKGMLEMTFK
jgi:muramoyltetrapeptide carboxypeptidase